METSKTLRRPINWQDFETLCKKLWGEVWKCSEIKKNGRSGQNQHGVDVYGIPFGETDYCGIQCKGKEEYDNKQFTEKEITKEIKNAMNFEPALKKLYFATTALKDAKIETFVRKKNLENIAAGLFEVHIFSWEDIVDLIDENRQTHDWYVKSQNYKTERSVTVTFDDSSVRLLRKPKIKQLVTYYTEKQTIPDNFGASLMKFNELTRPITNSMFHIEENLSYFQVALNIHNTGTAPLEDFKLSVSLLGGIQGMERTNVKDITFIIPNNYYHDIRLDRDNHVVMVVPANSILVGDDNYTSDDFFLKTSELNSTITLKWKLLSKHFKDEGELFIDVEPEIIKKRETIIVNDASKSRIETKLEDHIIKRSK